MRKILIFGNSGSGKSTLAKRLCAQENLSHLDLDSLAWQDSYPPQRKPLGESLQAIEAFCASHLQWVIEGCYSDLLQLCCAQASEIIFLDLPVETCRANARNRPWEPHKYASKQEQDKNLEMLLDWIADYDNRQDEFSRHSHQALFDGFSGQKHVITQNQEFELA